MSTCDENPISESRSIIANLILILAIAYYLEYNWNNDIITIYFKISAPKVINIERPKNGKFPQYQFNG